MGTLNKLLRSRISPFRDLVYKMVPFGMRYGKKFNEKLRFLQDSVCVEQNVLEEYQNLSMQTLVWHVYNNVPFYRDWMKDQDVHPKDFKTVKDIAIFPILTRRDVFESRHELIAENLRYHDVERRTFLDTSGSTGEPLQCVAYKDIYEIEAAFIERVYQANGQTLYFDKSAWLRRWCPDPETQPLWYEDKEQQRLYLSPFHLTRSNLSAYVDAINKYKCSLLVGYPSSIYILACFMEERPNLNLDHIRHAQVSSEMLHPEWEEKIEKVLGITVRDHYGQVEKTCLHHRCIGGNSYHDNLEYGITEILEDGKILGTGFNNYLMPLIRYDTGDFARTSARKESPCPDCGISLPFHIKRIEGRFDDILETPNGAFLPPVNFYSFMGHIRGVRMFQLIQEDKDHITCQIVPTAKYSNETERTVLGELRKRLGKMQVYYVLVDEIPRDKKTGKIRNIIRRNKSEPT